MFKNYLKTTFRSMQRNKAISLINITGLAAGIAFCMMIIMHISFEKSFDAYHRDAHRIYRIGIDISSPDFKRTFAPISYFMAPYLRENFPQVEAAARFREMGSVLVRHGDRVYYENRYIRADNDIFNVLTFPFLQGDPETALTRPATLVISESMAHKYFGKENPLGQILNLSNADCVITGVMKDPPANSHLKFDLIASMKGDEVPSWMRQHWFLNVFYTYVKFRPGVDVNKLFPRIEEGALERRGEDPGSTYRYFLQPLRDIHLHSHLSDELAPPGNPTYLLIFGVAAVLILVIASVNFINLSTARAAVRAKEVGMRKIVGALRRQLIFQFVGESLLTTFLAVCLASLSILLLLPLCSRLMGSPYTLESLLNPSLLLALFGILLFSGVLAGSYPAFVLSAYTPISIFKGKKQGVSQGNRLRRILVIGQFAVSFILVSGTIVMTHQVQYMKNRNLGFVKEQKLVLPVGSGAQITRSYEAVKSELKKLSGVLEASVSSSVPGRLASGATVKLINEPEDKSQWMYYLFVDEVFVPQYGMTMAAGRNFRKEADSSRETVFMINEAAMRKFGWTNPSEAIGKRILSGFRRVQGQIIGVVGDFHFSGLQNEIGPVIFTVDPDFYRYITLTLSTENLGKTISSVKHVWENFFPGIPFRYAFLDTYFARFYRQEEQAGTLVLIFGILALSVACLGILGLAANTTQQRTKEIGIRKVIGASSSGIVVLLTWDFIKWVCVANIFSWPASTLIFKRWLSGFAYRTSFSLWFLMIPCAAILVLAVLSVSFHTFRSARMDPVETLRYE